jgi:hypothetical protein
VSAAPEPPQQREHFRIDYPAPERPELQVAQHRFVVLDLSERGLRFVFDKTTYKPVVGATLAARIVFKGGGACSVGGKILRVLGDKSQCVLYLDPGVPQTKMMEEHRRILQKYHTPAS